MNIISSNVTTASDFFVYATTQQVYSVDARPWEASIQINGTEIQRLNGTMINDNIVLSAHVKDAGSETKTVDLVWMGGEGMSAYSPRVSIIPST